MTESRGLSGLLRRSEPILALAPMQDVTDLAFWRVLMAYGGPDLLYTEYFRVHPTSNLEKWILQSAVENTTGLPVLAQMIGNDVPSLVRSARELERYPVIGIDLNLGCPAPVVYRKCAGGGLLRDPPRVSAILEALRANVQSAFTVKTRVGFDSADEFDALLEIFCRHPIDLLAVHGRTVREMYRPTVHYDRIAQAMRALPGRVLANGGVDTAAQAVEVLRVTGARGLMIGRGAIRNPWIFRQIRQALRGEPVFVPTGFDVLEYVRRLYDGVRPEGIREAAHVHKMKKYLNFIGAGIEPAAEFLYQIRRAQSEADVFGICERFLAHDRPMRLADAGLAEAAPVAC